MSGLISWILMGLIAGALGKWIMPGKDPGGIIVTILLGIGGALLGGWIGSLLGIGYLAPIVARAFFVEAPAADASAGGLAEAPVLCVVPLCLTALGSVALFFLAEPLLGLLAPLAGVP